MRNQPTYLPAGVEIVATYQTPQRQSRVKLEGLISIGFGPNWTSPSKTALEAVERGGFLVPLHVIDEVVQRLVDGTLTGVVYDAQAARSCEHELRQCAIFQSLWREPWRSLNDDRSIKPKTTGSLMQETVQSQPTFSRPFRQPDSVPADTANVWVEGEGCTSNAG